MRKFSMMKSTLLQNYWMFSCPKMITNLLVYAFISFRKVCTVYIKCTIKVYTCFKCVLKNYQLPSSFFVSFVSHSFESLFKGRKMFLINAMWHVFSFRFREISFNDPKLAQQAEWRFPSISPFSLSKVSAAACKCHSQWTSWKVTMLGINDYERKN